MRSSLPFVAVGSLVPGFPFPNYSLRTSTVRGFHKTAHNSLRRSSVRVYRKTTQRMSATSTESRYAPFRMHPCLFGEDFQAGWLHNDFIRILDAFAKEGNKEIDPALIFPELLKKEMRGVYSFNAFNNTFLRLFNEEIRNFYEVSDREKIPVRRPNSMNNYGVVLNEIGMRPLITAFQQIFLWPLCQRLFPLHASQFDDHHSFIVRYRAEEDLGLDMHTDDSDVTFNVCLGDNFTGASLSFCGMFGAPDHRQHNHTYNHQVGRAVLHLGSRRHGADDIESGSRTSLIIWNHNWAYRASGGYRNVDYEREEGPPSLVCLSYTHDRDYQSFKEIPESAKNQNLRPWCPPVGTEYDGFCASKRRPDTTTIIQSQDEL